ncbi:hypothetical protein PSMK_27620 [Phycisphaera mikurensis NBRC 102666]|uniref:Rubredoxin-like domain-containing protein n=1 Tax=Phycisphaera mikurensis (strain NBRC 102666 / KCTC 22515 / FYK2301M01) TaxID=1142394 RepID=I0II33_PHYMF|nr:hypothetical protein PSMK_27620 [Phycisphaera mikurensis NBRC 102666]
MLPRRVGVAVVDKAMGKPARGPVPARELAIAVGLAAVACWLADRVVPFPWNAVVLGFALVVAGAVVVSGRRRARREREAFVEETVLPDGRFRRCAACGYTLSPAGITPPRLCPECGTPTVRLAR